MRKTHAQKEAGFTFAELAFGMLIMVIDAVVLINHISVNFQTTNTERDRVFAYSKAQAILAEIQLSSTAQVDAAVDLDVLDRSAHRQQEPAHHRHGPIRQPGRGGSRAVRNYQRDTEWVWARRITVQPFVGLNNRNVRYVTVRILRGTRTAWSIPWPTCRP